MHDFGFFAYDSKEQFLERSKTYWNPGKTQAWQDFGVDIVIGRREGYFIYDMSGKRLINLAGSINRALGAEDEPIVVNRAGPHVSFKNLEELIDKALED